MTPFLWLFNQSSWNQQFPIKHKEMMSGFDIKVKTLSLLENNEWLNKNEIRYLKKDAELQDLCANKKINFQQRKRTGKAKISGFCSSPRMKTRKLGDLTRSKNIHLLKNKESSHDNRDGAFYIII